MITWRLLQPWLDGSGQGDDDGIVAREQEGMGENAEDGARNEAVPASGICNGAYSPRPA
jgi:hypothetical protein